MIIGHLPLGNSTGYLHWQICVAFKKKVSLKAVKETFGQSAHCEPSRSAAANDYVNKEDTAVANTQFALGILPVKSNSKQDWDRIWDLAKAGKINDIPANIRIRHYTTIKKIRTDFQEKPLDLDSVTGTWIYGEPGVGKSRLAREMAPHAYIKAQNKWWDGYQHQEDVILDDLDSDCLGHYLKIWADCYSFTAEVKGGSMQIRPKRIIVTSNYKPCELFKDDVMGKAITRRFNLIHKINFIDN